MWRGSECRRTRSPATTGSAGTTCSWSAGPTSTGRRSWSPRTPRTSLRVRRRIASARLIREDLLHLGLSYDLFTRTTTRNHHDVTRDIFRTLYEKGFVVEQETLGAFSASTGHTLPDRYIEGTCPICGFPSARGDQCDNCGNQLDPIDLIDPRSTIDGEPPVFRTTKHLFLDLPAFKEQLTAWIESQDDWRPNVKRFSLNFVRELKPRAMTRDLDWGVPIPVAGYEEDPDKRIYVWIDAVVGYLSAVHRMGAQPWHARRLAGVVAEPRRRARLLHGEGQHRLPHGDLAEHAARVRRRRRLRRGPRRPRAPGHDRVERVPDDGGEEVQLEPWRPDLRARLPRALRPRLRCATSSPSPARRPRTPTSRGPSSSAGTTTSSWRRGGIS